jgi:pullulanase
LEDLVIIHDSHDIKFRNPFGAVQIGTKVKLRLVSNRSFKVHINLVNFYNNQIQLEMKEVGRDNLYNYFNYQIDIDTADLLGVNYYYFVIDIQGQILFYGNNIEGLGGKGEIYSYNPKYYQITVYNAQKIPDWYKEGIIYQIFVDRFFNGNEDGRVLNPKKNSFIYGNWHDDPMYIKNSNGELARWDFYGGNLLGVRKKLNYIKSLGVNIIYFNPIFESSSCHKYDTGDYEKIDPMMGSNEDFKSLCEEANKLGIRIILDGVFSHTGSDSKYFNKFDSYESLGAYQSLNSPYYRWYKFHNYPNIYECWWGFSNMPNVDELNPSYLEYIVKSEDAIVKKWLKLGASGWRLDVADELPDEFIKQLRQSIKEVKEDSVLIGEVWEDASNKISYSRKREYLFGYELDSVTNYPLRQLIIDVAKRNISSEYFVKRYMNLLENYPKEIFYSTMNMLGNHDTERILTLLNNNIKLLNIAIVLQMTLPGVPLIYYGDEAGLTGFKDPENRKSYPWGRENKNILSIYKVLSNLRAKEDILKFGDIKFRECKNNVLCFDRYSKDELIITIISFSEKSETYRLKEFRGRFKNLIDKMEVYDSEEEEFEIKLKSNECKILKRI